MPRRAGSAVGSQPSGAGCVLVILYLARPTLASVSPSAAIERAGRLGCIPAACTPEWFVTTGCTRRRNVNVAPNRHLAGPGNIDRGWSGESYPARTAQTTQGKPDASMRRQNAPHSINTALGKGPRHVATGSAHENRCPCLADRIHGGPCPAEGMNPRRAGSAFFMATTRSAVAAPRDIEPRNPR
jgi:hypothetical protein